MQEGTCSKWTSFFSDDRKIISSKNNWRCVSINTGISWFIFIARRVYITRLIHSSWRIRMEREEGGGEGEGKRAREAFKKASWPSSWCSGRATNERTAAPLANRNSGVIPPIEVALRASSPQGRFRSSSVCPALPCSARSTCRRDRIIPGT